MLSRNPEGKLCLEDGEGRVPLDMEDAVSLSTLCLMGKKGENEAGADGRCLEKECLQRDVWS